ncbi:MAG: mitochondrial fission ELM1 family protein [Rickettsiales bacterium]|nr:mitochondrial fission ELM1 family protein [Rickettsiales bacterium]
MSKIKTCWVITNGSAGTVSQALGLAQAIGFKEIKQKIFKANFTFSLIPSIAHIFLKRFLSSDSDKLEKPWPDVIIGCGRRVIPFLLYIKKTTKGKTYCIYVQDPRISTKYFDLIVKMQHDPIKGDNVITTDFSLNLVNRKRLISELKKYKRKFTKFSAPYFTILIGGNTKRYKMSDKAIQDLLNKIKKIIKLCSGSVLITTSRRTPNLVTKTLMNDFSKNNKVYITTPNSKDGNLYFAMLALAEKVFVTNDSVNMISEACACEKPVYILELFDISLGKTEEFLHTLNSKNLIKTFNGRLSKSTNRAIFCNNNELIAKKIKNRLLKEKICSFNDFV